VEFESLEQYRRAVALARVRRGDVIYVSRPFYATLAEFEKSWLWQHSLDWRVQLVTDLELDAPIVVRAGLAAGEQAKVDSPRVRGPFYRDVRTARATILFGGVAAFERALQHGVIGRGDCVQFTPEELWTLPAETYRRLEREVETAGACLCEGEPPTPIAVFRGRADDGTSGAH